MVQFQQHSGTDTLTGDCEQAAFWLNLSGGACALILLVSQIWVTGGIDYLIGGALIWLALSFFASGLLLRDVYLDFGIANTVYLTSLVLAVAAITGGVNSFIIPWLIAFPVAAALAASPFRVSVALVLSLVSVTLLFYAGDLNLLPASRLSGDVDSLNAAGMATALIYTAAHGLANCWIWGRQEQTRRTQDRKYQWVSKNTGDVVSVHDIHGRSKMVSMSAKQMFGSGPEELTGEGFLTAIHEHDRKSFVACCCRAIDVKNQSSADFRVLKHSHSGSHYIWTTCNFRSLNDDDAGEAGCIVVTRDITAKMALQRQLDDALATAGKAEEAKNQLLANVTHELRTPLNAIIGFSDILKGELDSEGNAGEPEALTEYANLICESGLYLLQVVNELLDMSKIGAGHYTLSPESVDLAELLNSTARMIEPLARQAGVSLVFDFSDTGETIVADKRAVRQIVLNLLSNAVKFSNPGSTIILGFGIGDQSATLWVQDQGIGVSEDDQLRMGEPFFQAESNHDRHYQGTGLGLSVVKGLVEIHQGTFLIASELGTGTTIRVCLPKHSVGEIGIDGITKTSKAAA